MPKVSINLSVPLSLRIDADDLADIDAEAFETADTRANIIRRNLKAHRKELAAARGFRYSKLGSTKTLEQLQATS